MNILYCGDGNIEQGLTLSLLSLLEHQREPLQVYVLTAVLSWQGKDYRPISQNSLRTLEQYVQKRSPESSISRFDITDLVLANLPEANMGTRFTPCCMLRLYADRIPELPDRLLYLDTDVLCRGNLSEFYHQDLGNAELAGVLDYYGRWFFRKRPLHMDYLNSGVLLLNLARIRQTGLFARCLDRCTTKNMFMPDQSAINKLAEEKIILPRKYNEQRKLKKDTVLQHFTTSFRLFPLLHTVCVKPWDRKGLHNTLKLHEYDGLLAEFDAYAAQKGRAQI